MNELALPSTAVWVAIAAIVLLLLTIRTFNRLVRERNGFRNAFAQIEVQLQRRYDLVPNLVETAKGALAHERETLTAVTQARNSAHAALQALNHNPANPEALQKLSVADGLLSTALRSFNLAIEAYPELKANTNMLQLAEELNSTESRIGFARQAFNDSAMGYNNLREVFPNNIVAGLFGFAPAAFLQVDSPEARKAPSVKF